ncbi:hypothetical protein [Rhodococcus koreensis]
MSDNYVEYLGLRLGPIAQAKYRRVIRSFYDSCDDQWKAYFWRKPWRWERDGGLIEVIWADIPIAAMSETDLLDDDAPLDTWTKMTPPTTIDELDGR